jgi:hypothetical protein
MGMQRSFARLAIVAIIIMLTLQACSSIINPGPTPTPFGAFPLVSQFRSLYDKLGGEAVVGKSISPVFSHNNLLCQYTENLLMCFDTTATVEANRLSIMPIGQVLIKPPPGQTFEVYEGFQEMYDLLFKERYVGKPLTGIRYNKDKRRIEQYFENMGFYEQLDDPHAAVRLLAYGTYECGEYCAYKATSSAGFIAGYNIGVELIGASSLERLGGVDVFGSPVTQPYTAADGNQEQVLENALIYIPKDNPSTLRLRPLAQMLKVRLEAPGPQLYGVDQHMIFYFVQGSLGYHVPDVFDQFIISHGGKEISGNPTSDPFHAPGPGGVEIPSQCFENYCLQLQVNVDGSPKVSLMSLGNQYRQKVKPDNWVFEFSPATTILKASEMKPQVTSQEEQVIQVKVFQAKGLLPISDIGSILVVRLPDGTKASYDVPLTDQSGTAKVILPPVNNAATGTVIPFAVCLNVPADTQICASGSYLIWNAR